METNKDFKFTLNISAEGYELKTDATCCLSSKGAKAIGRKKMCFFENTINVDEFIEKAYKGHSFCALYRFHADTKYWYSNKKGQKFLGYPHYRRDSKTATKGGLKIDFKRDEYFSGSQVIFIDIDYTKYTDIEEYIEKLEYKPTCVYMSYSDNKDKGGRISRRFHLVYVFNSILSADEFKLISSRLSQALVRNTGEELDDDCGERMSQYMNGCFGNSESYKTYTIYSIEDIKEYIVEDNNIIEEEEIHTINLILQKKFKVEFPEEIEDFDYRLLDTFDALPVEEFKKCGYWVNNYLLNSQFTYIFKPITDFGDNNYSFVDSSYFSLYYYNSQVKDGSSRRKKLYQRMCLRRVINPNITKREMVYNTIMDIISFFDNSDGLLGSDFIIRNINNCFELSIDDILEEQATEIKYLQDLRNPKRGIIYKNKEAHSQETTFQIIDKIYESGLSVKENLEKLNKYFPISQRTLYNYLRSRDIMAKGRISDSEALQYIDKNKTVRENLQFFKDNDIKMSFDRVRKLLKIAM